MVIYLEFKNASIDDFDVAAMVDLVERRRGAAERTMEINRILRSAMTEEDARIFAKNRQTL